MPDLSPNFLTLVYDALLKSFWRKAALRKFLRQSGIAESFLATWAAEEPKRSFLDRLFEKLHASPKGPGMIRQLGAFLSEQTTFPDLQNWEDSAIKISEAHKAVDRLGAYIRAAEEKKRQHVDQEEIRKRYRDRQVEVRRSQQDLVTLNDRLTQLTRELGTATAGYSFQAWFYDLIDFCEIVNRRPYTHDGRQIDGSLTHGGTTYLIELKFTVPAAGATDVDSFLKKVNDKADNTMGIIVSMSGYTSVAKKEASGPRTPLLLLEAAHLFLVLTGTIPFADVLDRIRRHSSQTGEAYLAATAF